MGISNLGAPVSLEKAWEESRRPFRDYIDILSSNSTYRDNPSHTCNTTSPMLACVSVFCALSGAGCGGPFVAQQLGPSSTGSHLQGHVDIRLSQNCCRRTESISELSRVQRGNLALPDTLNTSNTDNMLKATFPPSLLGLGRAPEEANLV